MQNYTVENNFPIGMNILCSTYFMHVKILLHFSKAEKIYEALEKRINHSYEFITSSIL